jgi:mono/diheme cytochrome c family protein
MKVALALAVLLVTGCRTRDIWYPPDLDLNRMEIQPRLNAYKPGAMQWPPEGTRRFNPNPVDRRIEEGVDADGKVLSDVPVPLSRAFLQTGRQRYETFCGPCHGVRGTAQTPVAERMSLRPPPSLHQPRIRALLPGDVFRIVSHGYGLMPSYASPLEPMDRWAVVAYLKVLQESQDVPVADLTPEERHQLEAATGTTTAQGTPP